MFVPIQDPKDPENLVPLLEYFVDRTCLPSWRIDRHALPYHDLTWVLSGTATYWCDGEPLVVKAGDLLYLPQGSFREAKTDPTDPMHCLACNFQCRTLDGGNLARLPIPRVSFLGFPEDLRDLYRRLNQAWLERDFRHALEVRGLMSLILHHVLQMRTIDAPEEPSIRLAQVRRHIILHYTRPISVGELAALVRLHPSYFGTWFRQQTGQTVHEYINRIRVRKAEDLLSTGGFNVSEAAEKCGFSDVFYFSKVFRKLTGSSPSERLKAL